MTSVQTDQAGSRPGSVVRLGVSLVALGAVIAGKALIACRIRRAPEGWRRTLGILLRSEPTRFALSAFGLRVPGPPSANADVEAVECGAADALRAFLATQRDAHFGLEWHDAVTIRRRIESVDVARLRFSGAGDLERLTAHLTDAAQDGPAAPLRHQVHQAIVAAYNRTRHLPEVHRPSALLRAVESACSTSADRAVVRNMLTYARRLLSACCLSFETIDMSDSTQRFRPPDFRARRNLAFGFLSVVIRLASDQRAADVWMSAHHVGLDGVPLQELVSELERAWGTTEPVVFPAADDDRPFMDARVCSVPGERDVHEMLAFVDFSPVFALREVLNERYAGAAGGPITFGALLAWLLSREPEFAGVRIASTVDVAASAGYDRDVDVVPLRPADFAKGEGPWDGFADFSREFNRLIAESRARTSPLRRQMQTAGLLPASVHSQMVRSDPAALDETFGSLCVTIIRDAKVFVAPMTDLGLGHGFFGIGNTGLAGADGRRVTAVSIKGDAGTIAGHPAILRRVIDRCSALGQQSRAAHRGSDPAGS
jgi:hypothetical protein